VVFDWRASRFVLSICPLCSVSFFPTLASALFSSLPTVSVSVRYFLTSEHLAGSHPEAEHLDRYPLGQPSCSKPALLFEGCTVWGLCGYLLLRIAFFAQEYGVMFFSFFIRLLRIFFELLSDDSFVHFFFPHLAEGVGTEFSSLHFCYRLLCAFLCC